MVTTPEPNPAPGVSTILPGEFPPNPKTIIKGSDYHNTLLGTEQEDTIEGNRGDDLLLGLGDRDLLIGGDGNDILTGGLDPIRNDFAFDQDDGNDIITDFKPAFPHPDCPKCIQEENPDTIQLADRDGAGGYEAIIEQATETPEGYAVVHYGETTITLIGVTPEELTPANFRG